MPDEDRDDGQRGGRLLPALFWAGVGLAPLAGLLLLFAGGAGLRIGGFLGVLSVVLIGLSIALRPDTGTVRLHLEEMLLEEMDGLRAEVREEIANAARATHQTVGERIGAVQQQLDSMRAELIGRGAGRPGPVTANAAAPHPEPSAYSTTRSGGPPPPTAPSRPPQAGHSSARESVSALVPRANGRASASVPAAGTASVNGPHRSNGPRPARQQPEPRSAVAGRSVAPVSGVYRHTETVQVTRSTYVGEHPASDEHDRGYDDGYGSREWSTVVPRSRAAEAFAQSWTDEKLREQYGHRSRSYDHDDDRSEPADDGNQWGHAAEQWPPVSAVPVSRGRARRRAEEDSDGSGDDQRWSAGPSDDRLPTSEVVGPAARSAGRGHELRMGERHTARHSGEHGTELRIEERWAAVRRDDDFDGPDYEPDYGRSDYGRVESGRSDYGRDEPGRADYGRRALPSASSEPSWNDSWEEPVPQPPGRRRRADVDDYGSGGSRHQRRLDFEVTDDRWR